MRLLLGFVGVCVLMVGVLVWFVAGNRPAKPSQVVSTTPPAVERAAEEPPAIPLPNPVVSTAPTSQPVVADPAVPADEPAPAAPTSAPVQWAVESAGEEGRLARAQAALQDDPYNETALRDAATAAAALEQWPLVAEFLTRLVDLQPDDMDTRFELAAVLLRQRRFIEAAAELQVVVAQRPDDVRAWSNLATAHQALGHLAAARQAWDRVIELAPTPDSYARRAEVLLDQHAWPAATADLKRVLEADPDAADVVLNLALALEREGEPAAARECLRAFLERHPQHVPALNRLAMLLQADCAAGVDGACAELSVLCQRSLAIDPNQPAIRGLLAETAGPS